MNRTNNRHRRLYVPPRNNIGNLIVNVISVFGLVAMFCVLGVAAFIAIHNYFGIPVS